MSERAEQRVLVIDDDDLSREVLEVLLGGEGYHVDAVSSGDEALGMLERGEVRPDAVLTDMQMPGISGEALARRLREVCPAGTPVIAMSGSRPRDLAGYDGFLLKPFSMAEFGEVLRGMAGRRETAAGGTGEEVLDARIVGGFEASAGKAATAELYRTCVRDAEKQLGRMRAAADAGDDGGFRESAHAIKGSLGMVGAMELRAMCSRLEQTGLSDSYVATLGDFPAAIERLRGMLIARGIE